MSQLNADPVARPALAPPGGWRSLSMVASRPWWRRIAVALATLASVTALGLAFIPWRQTVSGAGRVGVFEPADRPQTVEAQIPARIVQWKVVDGQRVKAGEVLARLEDLDSKFLNPELIAQSATQRASLARQRDAALARATRLGEQFEFLASARRAAMPISQERAARTGDLVRAADEAVTATRQRLETEEARRRRVAELFAKQLRSRQDDEFAERDLVVARTEVQRAEQNAQAARRDRNAALLDVEQVEAATAGQLAALEAAIESAGESVAKTDESLAKLDQEIDNLKLRVAQQRVLAPRDGTVVRLAEVGAGATVKAGDQLLLLAPDTADQAVELLISDNDAPLVDVGRKVRLQFAGWPALQFSGFPAVAVGTYGGVVANIDAIDDGKSRYRLIVKPDTERIAAGQDQPWPGSVRLRTGAKAAGWIMLENVSLGYELWRRFNNFPPSIDPRLPALSGAFGKDSGYGNKTAGDDPDAKDDDKNQFKIKAKSPK